MSTRCDGLAVDCLVSEDAQVSHQGCFIGKFGARLSYPKSGDARHLPEMLVVQESQITQFAFNFLDAL